MVRDSLTLTCHAATAVVSVSATAPVIAIPRPSANRYPINHAGTLATHGNPDTAAGTGIIISGMSDANTGAVALL